MFNSLAKELRDFKKGGIDEFKKALDAFMCTIPDEPKCPGLTPGATDHVECTPSNSVLHQIPRAWREGYQGAGWTSWPV